MKDKLEQFVQQHRDAFDSREAHPELWNKIEKSINRKKPIKWGFYLSRVAVVVLIFSLSFLVQKIWLSGEITISISRGTTPEEFKLKEAENYYSGVMQAKLEEAGSVLSNHPSLEKELHSDLAALDSIYQSLKADLQDNIATEEVVEALVQNYRLRIEILEDLLTFFNTEEDQDSSINNSTYEL